MATALVQRTAGPLPAVVSRSLPLPRRALISHLYAVADVRSIPARAERPELKAFVVSELVLERREGEDAKITGGTRSLTRRVLALNLAGSLRLRESSPGKTLSGR